MRTPRDLIYQRIMLLASSHLGREKIAEHTDALAAAFSEFEINTVPRINAALAQFSHETYGFRWLRELGGPSYFLKYEGRKDLGNTQPGDGRRYKGRGYIMITGRSNYRLIGQRLKLTLLEQPELAEQPLHAARISSCWWQEHGLNELSDRNEFRMITRIINGGYNGYKDRLNMYYKLLLI